MKPQAFGRYLLLDKVASGGMAEVWRAKLIGEAGFERIVAIKKILPHVCEDQDFITMFTDEAKITVQLQHSNIGQVYEFSKHDGIFYIGMEYISGKDLKTIWSYCRSRKQVLPLDMACLVVQKMADGLDYAHRKKDNFGKEQGIVHRDVSPQNCLISWDGEVKVIDFGIAKAAGKSGKTRAGTLKGKFAYMSPEQIRGLSLDGRADIFALGIVLYELVTGERGFQAESEFSLLEMVRNVEIKPPTMVNKEIPQELERIIFKALAKDREHRYRYASDFSEDLQRFLLGRGKPPGRHDLGKYLRENFTVDYDKERLRLESYKEIQWEAVPEESRPHRAAPKAPPPASLTAVQAALAEDHTSTFLGDSGAFAGESGTFAPMHSTQTGASHPGMNALQSGTGTGYVMTGGERENTQATPANVRFAPPMQAQTQVGPAPKRGGVVMGMALALGILVVLGLIGGGIAWFALSGSGVVTLTVQGPAEADVLLDGVAKGTAAPSLTIPDVSSGAHDVIVQTKGYVSKSRTINVESGKTVNLKVDLQQAPGRISISSEPPGAQIQLNGKDTGKVTPATISAPAGVIHQFSLVLEDFNVEKISRKLEPATDIDLEVRLRPEVLHVEIATVPSGATVEINGKRIGKSPVSFQHDPSLPYPKLVASKRKCKDIETTLPLEKDRAKQKFAFTLKCK